MIVYSSNDAPQEVSGNADFVVPSEIGELVFVLTATDIFDQTSTTNWRYTVGNNSPPTINIRTPVAWFAFDRRRALHA